jgi:hypothetical protein
MLPTEHVQTHPRTPRPSLRANKMTATWRGRRRVVSGDSGEGAETAGSAIRVRPISSFRMKMELHRHMRAGRPGCYRDSGIRADETHTDATGRWLHVKRRTPRASLDSVASRRLHRLPAAVSRQSSLARRHAALLPSPTATTRLRAERPSRRSASCAEEGIRVATAAGVPPRPSPCLGLLASLGGERRRRRPKREERWSCGR